jgi:hypothetical protein
MIKLNDLQFKLKQIGDFVIEQAFPNVGLKEMLLLKGYKLQLTEKEYKSRLGSYALNDKTVEVSAIYNTYFADVVLVLLHEITHHIEIQKNDNASHDANFYKTHLRLISAAIDSELLTCSDVIKHANNTTAQNKNKLADMISKYIPSKNRKSIKEVIDLSFVKEYNKLKPISEVIKIKCSSSTGAMLKHRGYQWEENEKIWYKKFHMRPDHNSEINFLIDNNFAQVAVNHQIYFCNEIILVLSGNTYKHREELKRMGYTYTDKLWEKRIHIKNYKKEHSRALKIQDVKLHLKYIK